MNSVLILSHSITPRLRYVIDFFSRYYGTAFGLTSDEDRYRSAAEKCRINYSYHRLDADEIFIHSHPLLFETSVRPVKVECFEKKFRTSENETFKAFFKTEGEAGFDIFAAVFYLITRYEEYLQHQKDAYGRFAHENGIAFREEFLRLPLVDVWLEDFRHLLAEKEPSFARAQRSFRFLPTYDIDIAWSYRNKGIARNFGAVMLLAAQGKFRKMLHRISVIRGKKPDPFDAYAWMDELHERFDLVPLYFFLVAGKRSRYDRNIDPSNEEFRQLVHHTATHNEIGLHPSWASGDDHVLLAKEKHTLEHLSGHAVTSSRQHYIRFDLPETYRRLISLGITHDYSMGYGSINGFRASTATPFYWYDLKSEESTHLLVHPFCFMDANACYEQKYSPEETLQELISLYDACRVVNGTMISIWHNSFLGTDSAFVGWRNVYEQFLSSIKLSPGEKRSAVPGISESGREVNA